MVGVFLVSGEERLKAVKSEKVQRLKADRRVAFFLPGDLVSPGGTLPPATQGHRGTAEG